MKKQLYIFGVVVLLLSIALSGCEEIDIISGTGEIKYIDLEGGFYGIVADDSEHYDPTDMPSEFKEDGLRVSFIVKILENRSSIHMWGSVVKILKIEKLNSSKETNATGDLINYTGCIEPDTNYSRSQDCMEYDYDGENILLLKHVNAGFNCCPKNITADIKIDNYSIIIEEIEIDGDCDCICLFNISYEIKNLNPGKYRITIIEPYVHNDEETLEFTIDLLTTPSGIFCVERDYYPWD